MGWAARGGAFGNMKTHYRALGQVVAQPPGSFFSDWHTFCYIFLGGVEAIVTMRERTASCVMHKAKRCIGMNGERICVNSDAVEE